MLLSQKLSYAGNNVSIKKREKGEVIWHYCIAFKIRKKKNESKFKGLMT